MFSKKTKSLRWCLVRKNEKWEQTSHLFSTSFSCLDKFYENRNRNNNDSDKNQILLISEISIHRSGIMVHSFHKKILNSLKLLFYH